MERRQRSAATPPLHISTKDEPAPEVRGAMERLSSVGYLIATCHEGRRAAVMARSVGVCGDTPPMVCAAVRKGHWIGPIIRDSHRFTLSQVSCDDRLVMRKFAEDATRSDADALDWLAIETMEGMPTLAKSEIALVCEVVRRIDLEAGHELLVGQVIAARAATGQDHPVRLHTPSDTREEDGPDARGQSRGGQPLRDARSAKERLDLEPKPA